MNVLLVYPKFPDTFWSLKSVLHFGFKKAVYPPLGLLTVASMLPFDWNKKLIDVNVNRLKNKDIFWADMVFISAMLIQKDSAKEIIKRCNFHGKKVVVGGPAFSVIPESFEGVDHFVLNEAESTLPLFLDDLKKGNLKRIYSSKDRPDITKTPLPLWSLINFRDYAGVAIQYCRGCPFNCEFCDIIVMNGRIPRTKTTKQMENEFQSLYDAGWRGIVFVVDDNFIGNKVKVKEMLKVIIEWQKRHNYPFKLMTEASVNLADDKELMNLMSKANFYAVFLGIETLDGDSLKECGKNQNLNRNFIDTVKTIHHAGIEVMGSFMVGFDTDKENVFDEQIKFIKNSGIVAAMTHVLNVVPKTPLWKRLKKEGRLRGITTGDSSGGNFNFEPKMGKKKLIEGYQKLVSTIYTPKNYYKRLNIFLKDYKPTQKGRPTFGEILFLFNSMFHIGILSRQRFKYWRILLKTFFTNINAMPSVVKLIIFGAHFEKVYKTFLLRDYKL